MLVLQRKIGQSIYIGEDVKITIQDISADRVKLAIDAPKSISIMREELRMAKMSNLAAVSASSDTIQQLKQLFHTDEENK